MVEKKLVHYYKKFEQNPNEWRSFIVYANLSRAGGIATILGFQEPHPHLQTHHLAPGLDQQEALAKAIRHLDQLYPESEGWNKPPPENI